GQEHWRHTQRAEHIDLPCPYALLGGLLKGWICGRAYSPAVAGVKPGGGWRWSCRILDTLVCRSLESESKQTQSNRVCLRVPTPISSLPIRGASGVVREAGE